MERFCECWKGFSKTVKALIITGIVLVVIGIGIGIGFGASSSKENNDVPPNLLTFTNHKMADMCKYFFFLFQNFPISLSDFQIGFFFLSLTFPISLSDFTIEVLSKNLITK